MIKKIMAILLIVVVTVASTVIFYWKDSQFDPGSLDLLMYLLVLPVLITTVFLTPWLIYRFYQARKRQQHPPETQAEAQTPAPPTVEAEWIKLWIYSAFSQTVLGENEEIIQALQAYPSPQLDMKLLNSYGLPILSYRMAELDEQASDADTSTSVRQQRIMSLIQQQIEQQTSYLSQIADHLKRSSLFFETDDVHEYRMHPAWIDPQAEYDPDPISSTTRLDPVSRLNWLNLHIILSQDLLHVWDDVSCNQWLHEQLGELGFLPQKVHVEYHFWGQDSASMEWFNLLQQLAQQHEQLALVIHADSEIDQNLVDERTWLTDHYIPAEFSGSCCVSALKVEVESLSPAKQLCISLHPPSWVTVLKQLGVQALPQYEQEQPFVIVLDDAMDLKAGKQLTHQFAQTPVEPHHYLYVAASMGHTRHLTSVYGYGLAMHFPDDQTVFIASAHPSAGYAVIQSVALVEYAQEAAAS